MGFFGTLSGSVRLPRGQWQQEWLEQAQAVQLILTVLSGAGVSSPCSTASHDRWFWSERIEMFKTRWLSLIVSVCFLVLQPLHAVDSDPNAIRVIDHKDASTAIRSVLATRAKHWADITSLSFHPSGKLLVSGGDDQAIRIWKGDSLELVDHIEFLPGLVHEVKFLSDGRIVVILHDATDEELYMYSSSTLLILKPSGQTLEESHWVEQSRLTGFTKHIQSVTATPDSKRLFFDDGSHAVHAYSLESERLLWIDTILFPGNVLQGTRGFPRPNGASPFPPSDHAPLLTMIRGLPSFRAGERPLALATSNDGATLLVLTDEKLRTYRLSELREPVSEVAISGRMLVVASNSESVVVGDSNGKLSVFDLLDNGRLSELPVLSDLESGDLSSLAISSDGAHLAASSVKNATCSIAAFADGKFGSAWTPLEVGKIDGQLGLAGQPFHWLYEMHNKQQLNLPLAFHPKGDSIALVGSRRQIVMASLNGTAGRSSPQQTLPGDKVAVWNAPDRWVRWIDDNETVFVATEHGAAKVNTKTGDVSGIIESVRPAAISVDGSTSWGCKQSDDGQWNPFIMDVESDDVQELNLNWLGFQQSLPFTISPDGRFLAQLNPDELQLDLFDATTRAESSLPFPNKLSRLIQFDNSNRLWAMYLSRSKTNEPQHNLVKIDVSSGLAAKVETVYQENASGASFDLSAQWVNKPELDHFTVSRNGEAVIYREREGAYKLLSNPSSRRSRQYVDAIRCLSNDGDFFLTLHNVNLGLSCVSLVQTQTGEMIQQWQIPGLVTDLDLSVDERSVATANADGSLLILSVKDRSDWPAIPSVEELAAESAEKMQEGEKSLKTLVDEFEIKRDAFEARLADATSKDQQTQIECDEPYSSHVIQLIQLSKQFAQTDVEYQALHRAIGMKRVTPPHVPGASWTDKRSDWYFVSSDADRQLTVIARLEFGERFIDDPRTASVLRPVIEYWVTKETERVIKGSWELSRRSNDNSVKAAALLIYSEVNMGEQREFLTRGHSVTSPTKDQLRKARATLQQVIREYGKIQIPGVGSVAEKANSLITKLDTVEQ